MANTTSFESACELLARARVAAMLLVAVATVGCGGDGGADDPPAGADAGTDAPLPACTPPAAPLPTEGELRDPNALTLEGCVTGGLRDLPGRWHLADRASLFSFSYPKFEGDCATGFRRMGDADDPEVGDDGASRHTWSDGTRYFSRSYRRFPPTGDIVFERTSALVACFAADGSLRAVNATFDPDRGVLTSPLVGTRFAPKDDPARGLERVGAIDAWSNADGPQRIVGYNVVVEQGTAYVVGPAGLDMIDVRTPANPVHLSHVGGPLEDADGFNDVRVVRSAGKVIAFVSALRGRNYTGIVDVTDPRAPVRLADIPEYSHSVFVRTQGERWYLYLATYTNAVPVYDVTQPDQPVRLGAPVVPGEEAGIHDLFADAQRIYANNTTAGMVAIDVSAGFDAPAVELGRVPTTYSHASWAATVGGRQVVIHGDEGMTPEGGAFMRILDGDPASPTYLSELSRYLTRPEVGIHNMMIVGDRAYVSYYQDGIRVVDLSDPTRPTEVAHYNTWDDATAYGDAFEGAVGVRVADGLVYAADIEQGLVILRETP